MVTFTPEPLEYEILTPMLQRPEVFGARTAGLLGSSLFKQKMDLLPSGPRVCQVLKKDKGDGLAKICFEN